MALGRARGLERVDPGQAFVIVAHLDQRSQRSAQGRGPIRAGAFELMAQSVGLVGMPGLRLYGQ